MRTEHKATPEALASLREQCAGKPGTNETECVISFEKWNPGYVEFLTTGRGADVAGIIDRCGSAITHYAVTGDDVWLRISLRDSNGRKVFRGFPGCFAPIDVESEPLPPGTFG